MTDVVVVDSARAKKALECLNEIREQYIDEGIEGGYITWDKMYDIMKKYGFERKR